MECLGRFIVASRRKRMFGARKGWCVVPEKKNEAQTRSDPCSDIFLYHIIRKIIGFLCCLACLASDSLGTRPPAPSPESRPAAVAGALGTAAAAPAPRQSPRAFGLAGALERPRSGVRRGEADDVWSVALTSWNPTFQPPPRCKMVMSYISGIVWIFVVEF